ncbi:MAG: NAD(P)-dependent alcohol dehydrogenase [Sphingobacterium sp.]|jgi:aryl-alcohol dehydrogenase|nr:NAD(P)-dependent alcohol dehydrogenase [Sphingobacterium sp.]
MEITAAVVKQKGGSFDLEKVRLDAPKSDEVLIKIVASGTCHTDMAARDQLMGTPTFPVVLGHEGSGIVEQVGKNVHHLQTGDHVVLTFGYCGDCSKCQRGLPAYCENFFPLNFGGSRLDGSHSHHLAGKDLQDNFFSQSSFATYAIAHKNNVIKVRKDVPLELLGPLGCGIQTGAGAVLNSLSVSAGASIIISGTGAVGLAGLLAAKAVSAGTIVAIDINEERLLFAKELGATHTINSKKEDVIARLKEIAPKGFDYAFDTTGIPEVIQNSLAALGSHSKMGIVGIAKRPLELEMNNFVATGLQIIGIAEGDSVPNVFIPRLVEMYRNGQFPFDKLIKTYAFEDINQAIADSETGVTIKPVLLIGDYKG